MTFPLGSAAGPMAPPDVTAATDPAAAERNRAAGDAARQFEAVLIQQLLSVLSKTTPDGGLFGKGPGSEIYSGMFEQSIAEQLSHQGIGMRPMLVRALGGEADETTLTGTTHTTSSGLAAFPGVAAGFATSAASVSGAPAVGETAALQRAAASLLTPDTAARFSRDGALEPTDLSSTLATREAGGEARFNVRDANGYQGYYKCNLFAFELARRAGFSVPVVGRLRGWGFPVPNTVADDARDGQVEGNWARVATHEGASSLSAGIASGRRAFMITGAAAGERAGHMAVVERLHEVDRAPDGTIRRIVFDGWEARAQGAQHLARRTWNLVGNPGGNQPRNGFEHIEILELMRPSQGERPEVPLSDHAGPSLRDAVSGSSSIPPRPNAQSEESS